VLLCVKSSLGGEVRFVDVTGDSGIDFRHVNGLKEQKDYIPETKGGGAGFFDYDNDGWLDVLMVQGSTLERVRAKDELHCELYRNRRDGTFERVTAKAGLIHRGWGMGVTFGDYDNDGWIDIYLTYLGPNVLYRNRGDGTFEEVTGKAGVGDSRWSTSAAFADFDKDGDLDLYVANYVFIDFERLPPKACQHHEKVVMCGPMGLPGVGDSYYRNNGDGTFSEVSEEVGADDPDRYYGLGVSFGDVDNDGDLDIYVANDATPNLLFVNRGDGTFDEMGLESGLAFSADGIEQASMGVDVADYDNDGLADVYITHFSDDYSTLYHNEGELLFKDVTGQALIMRPEVRFVSWGTAFIDFDHDGWKDIFHANGHVYPYLLGAGLTQKFYQPQSFYLNQKDGTFKDLSRSAGPGLEVEKSSRGVAFGDYDNDGDIDMLIANLNDPPSLIRNDLSGAHHWVMFKTVGRTCNREGIGTRISVTSGGLTQTWEIKRAKALYSASDPRAHFGFGNAKTIERVEVRWPDGKKQRFENVSADIHYVIDQEKGLRKEEFAGRPGDR
jgi:hypothetical protein